MKKIHFLPTIAVLAVAVSLMAVPAAADTQDKYYTYEWSDSTSRIDYTEAYKKDDSTAVYIKTVSYTLPYNGYYVKTYYGSSKNAATSPASKGEYYLNDYIAHIIKSNNVATGTSMAGKYVRIRGRYSDRTYSWGNCKIAWSPDTANESRYASLN